MRATRAGLLATIRDHMGFHILRIHPRVARRVFLGTASVRNCDGSCCHGGTTVSLVECDRVLAHAGIVHQAMTSRARRDPSRWFGSRTEEDPDFTVGRTTTTRVEDGHCVFYRSDGLCALQVAGQKGLGNPLALKPAVCLLWPLCVEDRTLQVGCASFTRRRECCAPTRTGERTILEVIAADRSLLGRMSQPENSRGGGSPASALRDAGRPPESRRSSRRRWSRS